MYFAELTPVRYHSGALDADCWRAPLLAVGWLEGGQPVTRGESPAELLPTLRLQIERARQEYAHTSFRGLHSCTLCERAEDGLIRYSHINLLIPGDRRVYAAPAGIVHYIESHGYLPPAEFVEAVLRCPHYGSPAFREALRTANSGDAIPLQSSEDYQKAVFEMQRQVMEHRARRGT